MQVNSNFFSQIRHSLPWLVRYPLVRTKTLLGGNGDGKKHLIFSIANHFEPAWKESGLHDIDTQHRRLDEWCLMARKIGEEVRDVDGTKFRHTNFYPAEQYDRGLLDTMADTSERFG